MTHVVALGVQVQNTILQAAKIIEGVSIADTPSVDLDNSTVSIALYDAMAAEIAAGTFSLIDADAIARVIETAANALLSGDALTTVLGFADDTAAVIDASNTLIEGYITEIAAGTKTGLTMLESIARVAVVANDAGDAISAAAGTGNFNTVNTNFITNVGTAITAAQIGDINSSNDAPVASDGSTTAIEDGELVSTVVSATDAEGGDLTYSLVGDAVAGLTLNSDGAYTFDPGHATYDSLEVGATSNVNFTYQATDDQGGTDTGNVIITVTGTNDTPIAVVETASVIEDAVLNDSVSATDADDASLTYNLVGDAAPAGLTFNADGTYSFDADNAVYDDLAAGETEEVSFTYQVSDDGRASDTETATITVTGTNDAPTDAGDADISVEDGGDITVTQAQLLSSISDVDSSNSDLSVSDVTVDNGTITDNGNGSWDIVLDDDPETDLTISYNVVDGEEVTAATQAVTINHDPTVSGNATFTRTEDTAFTLTKSQLLTNANDVDGNSLDVINVTVSSGGSILDNGDETWTITPTENSNANVVLAYSVVDGHGGSVNHGATVTINAVNDAPVLSYVTLGAETEDVSYTILESDLIAANVANDVDGDALSVTSVTLNHGSATETSDGVWTVTPELNYNGTVEVTYTVNDGTTSVSNTVEQVYLAANDAPTVSETDGSLSTNEDTSITFSQAQLLTDYASDVDGNSLSVQNVATENNGTLTDNGDNTWTFVPSANSTNAVTFSFDVSDGMTTTGGTAVLSINAINDAPTISGTALFNGVENGTVSISVAELLSDASDVESDTLSVTNLTASSGSLVEVRDEGGTLTGWTFTPASSGSVTFSYGVFDGTNTTSTTATATILSVAEANNAPTVGDAISLSGDEDGGEAGYITITKAALLAGAVDGDDDTLYIDGLSASSGSLIFDNTSGNWHFTPVTNSTANVTFSYNVTDGIENTAQTATLSLNALNDAPVVSGGVVLSSGTEDTVYALSVNDLIANASDVESDTLSIQSGSLTASSGAIAVDGEGWNFTPAGNSSEDVTFSYVIEDGNGGTISATATASFTAVNDAPTVSGDVSLSGDEDTNLTITKAQLLANATDVDDNEFLVQDLSATGNGVLTYNGDDTWTYVPETNTTTDITFSYNISDGTTTTAAQAVASFAADGITEGTANADTMIATDGNDTLTSLAGNDTITGGLGDDNIDGGEGTDTAVFSGNAADYSFAENDAGELTITDDNTSDGDDGTDVLTSIEKFQFADQTLEEVPDDEGEGNDEGEWIWGGNGVDNVFGGGGDDTILTFNGGDIIDAGSGDDWVWSGRGDDTVTGGSGSDRIYTDNGDDVITLSSGDVTISGGRGSDTLRLDGMDLNLTTNSVDLFSIETVDMATDSSANILTIGSSDILGMTDNDLLIITGDNLDTLAFSDSTWSQGSTSDGYTTYDHDSTDAQVQVNSNVIVYGV